MYVLLHCEVKSDHDCIPHTSPLVVSAYCETPVDDRFGLCMEQGSHHGLDSLNQQGSICLQIMTKLALPKEKLKLNGVEYEYS